MDNGGYIEIKGLMKCCWWVIFRPTGVYEHTQIESCWFQNKDSTITESELKEYQRQRLVKS